MTEAAGHTRILIAEDDEILGALLRDFLQNPEREITIQKNGLEAIRSLKDRPADVIIADLMLPGADGLKVLKEAKALHPGCEVIIITGYASLDTAIQAIRGGAYDYIRKPFKLEELEVGVKNASEKISLIRENRRLMQRLREALGEKEGLQKAWDEFLNQAESPGPKPPGPFSEADLSITLKQIPPDFDLQRQDFKEKALQILDRLTKLKKQDLIGEDEFSSFKKILLEKIS
ncbi:MAG: response regulator [Deltaproteobacteria bacterium]|nr:response regulator [Deltaproteobacteria bacterium]